MEDVSMAEAHEVTCLGEYVLETWPLDDGKGGHVKVRFDQAGFEPAHTAAGYLKGGGTKVFALLWAAACSALPCGRATRARPREGGGSEDGLAGRLARKVFDRLLVPDWQPASGDVLDHTPACKELLERMDDLEGCFDGPARTLFEVVRHAVRLALGDNEEGLREQELDAEAIGVGGGHLQTVQYLGRKWPAAVVEEAQQRLKDRGLPATLTAAVHLLVEEEKLPF
jgi:hypothetical protein